MNLHFVTAVLANGLGNRLFHLAAAFGYAIDHNRVPVIRTVHPNKHSSKDFTRTIFRSFPRVNVQPTFFYNEQSYDFFRAHTLPSCDGNLELCGHFQSEGHIKNHKEAFISRLEFGDSEVADKLPYPDTLFLHGRRGDYLEDPFYILNLEKYYENALELAVSRIGRKFTLAVFSNDQEYFRRWPLLEKFAPSLGRIIFVNEPDEERSLAMMSLCQLGGICPNSTFSWWAAYRLFDESKLVTFPKHWNNFFIGPVEIQFEGSVCLDV